MIIPGLSRIIGKLNSNRLLTDCVSRGLLSPNNCAFQKNRGAEDIYIDTTDKIYRAFQNGHFTELGFMDLDSAYDSVWLNGLIFRMMYDYGYDGNIIAWTIESMKGRQTRLKYSGIITQWLISRQNLPQGGSESPIE